MQRNPVAFGECERLHFEAIASINRRVCVQSDRFAPVPEAQFANLNEIGSMTSRMTGIHRKFLNEI